MRKYLVLFFVFILSVFSVQAAEPVMPAPGKYTIDAAHSKVGFEISHLVISTVEGKFNQFSGDITVAEKPEASKVETKIDVASISTGNEKRDNHLRSPDFFDVIKYPNMSFVSKKVVWTPSNFQIVGDLTLHGVTKSVSLDGKYLGSVKDQFGNDRLAFQAATKISRKDFGLAWSKMVEAGPVVGDEATISLKIEAVREKAAESVPKK